MKKMETNDWHFSLLLKGTDYSEICEQLGIRNRVQLFKMISCRKAEGSGYILL